MDRRALVAMGAGVLLSGSAVLRAQSHSALRRVGFLTVFARADSGLFVGLMRA